ncbi:MAG: DUF5317 domain-containing protein, partial [Firmicutes bacterium]|nr:DUF5317 domain-containing protein [Bacillota bacterium]
VLGLLKNGRLKGLADNMEYPVLLIISMLLEASTGLLVKLLPGIFPEYLWALVILQYALIFAFFMLNSHNWPVSVMALGVLLNFAVIISNGGRMPVSSIAYNYPGFTRVMDRIQSGAIPEYFIMDHRVPFWFLGDIIAIPLAGMASAGDLVMMAGMVLFIFICMTSNRPKHLKTRRHRRAA